MSGDKTTLHVSDADLPLSFLELTDEALGRFCRAYLIQIEKKVHESAGRRKMPLHLAMSMHGAIALYRMAVEANAGELVLEHTDVEWGGEKRGNWRLTLEKLEDPLRSIDQ